MRSGADGWVARAREAIGRFARSKTAGELHWSYVAIAVLVVVGAIVNIFVPAGWSAWPVVFCAGIFMMVHESADRNGQGVPPGHVYALFGVVLGLWVIVALAMSAIGPALLLSGLAVLGVFAARGYALRRQRLDLVEERRAQGLCVACGRAIETGQERCGNCGEDARADPAKMSAAPRFGRTPQQIARTRALLKGESAATGARRKEEALLNRRHTKGRGAGASKRGR